MTKSIKKNEYHGNYFCKFNCGSAKTKTKIIRIRGELEEKKFEDIEAK